MDDMYDTNKCFIKCNSTTRQFVFLLWQPEDHFAGQSETGNSRPENESRPSLVPLAQVVTSSPFTAALSPTGDHR